MLKNTYAEWQEDKVSRIAAALAYYTVFSLAPLLVIATTVAGLIWARSAVDNKIMAELSKLFGAEGAQFISSLMQNASLNLSKGVWTSVIGVGVLIFGAIGVFKQLRDALNTIWEVHLPEIKGIWKNIRSVLGDNLLSFAMVLGVGFLLLVSLLISTALTALNGWVTNFINLPPLLTSMLNTVLSVAIITTVFTLLYKYLPETKVAWGDVFLGGFVTALLFLLGKLAIGVYLGNSSIGTTFGAAGSLAIILIWVYYSAQIFFFGAEFTQVYANTYGSKIGESTIKADQVSHNYRLPTRKDDRTGQLVNVSSYQQHTSLLTDQGFVERVNYERQSVDYKKAAETARFLLGLILVSFLGGLLTRVGLKGSK